LKALAGAARTQVVAAELLDQRFVAVYEPLAPLDPGLGRVTFAAFACDLKTARDRYVCFSA